ncbi:MAG: nuclear transport factor 2 family protein [Acidimicrobiales bacterium]|nr:nuclear transport factor 2 family protein [Acidimicrobiales bacterium]
MIHTVMDNWNAHLRGEYPGGLDELLHDDCVFLSPIVFSPQRGKELTKMYLGAAGNVLPGDTDSDGEKAAPDPDKAFRYTKKVLDGNHAVLEFETYIVDTAVNGVDIITCDEDGKIIEFKVMIRPLKAINLVHANMKEMLEKMQA